MRTGLGAALLVLCALAGCSSDSAGDEAKATPSPTASPSPSAPATTEAVEAQGLRDICPQVESGLPSDPIPDYTEIREFYDALADYKSTGDLESQNALDLLLEPTGNLKVQIQYKAKGQPLVTALSHWLTGISAFADRCQAAGSSALQ